MEGALFEEWGGGAAEPESCWLRIGWDLLVEERMIDYIYGQGVKWLILSYPAMKMEPRTSLAQCGWGVTGPGPLRRMGCGSCAIDL